MNYNEYLKGKNITFQTSAKNLKKALEEYKKDSSSFVKTFKNLKCKENDTNLDPTEFLQRVIDWKDSIQELDKDVHNTYDVIVKMIESVIETKDTNKQIVKQSKINESLNVPDYIKSYEYKDVNLFETVLNCKPNKHDRELFKNFIIVGEQVAYCHDDSITLINTDLKNEKLEIGLNDYSKDDSLYDMICKDMAPLYETYMNKLKTKLAELDIESLETSVEEGNYGVIEDIFLNDIPTSFRHIVKVKSCWKTLDESKMLDKFVAKPLKSFGEMNTLEFTEFLKFLTRHFKDMTAGCLEKQDYYYTWSNDFKHKSVSTWLLPTKEEWEKAEMPECWKKFLTPKASPRIMQRVYFYLGAIQDASNFAQQALIISDKGQTGKGTLTRLLKAILPKKSFGFVVNNAFEDSNSFGLSNCNVYDNHIVCISEYDGKSLCSNKGKAAIGGDTLTLDVKNRHSIEWNTYGTKFFITSNEGCQLKEHSYRRRVIPVTFKQTHKMKDNFTSEQLDEFVKCGKEFLNYCYKIYKTCPLGTKSGEYLVMCPEMEQEYIKNGDLTCNDEERLLKAFTKDEEISEYFYVGDYSDSEETIDFENMLYEICDVTGKEDDMISSPNLKKLIINYCKDHACLGLFGLKKTGIDDYEIPTTGKGTQWWKFLQFIGTTDCKYQTRMVNGRKGKYFVGVVESGKANTASSFMSKMTNSNEPLKELSQDKKDVINALCIDDSDDSEQTNPQDEIKQDLVNQYEKAKYETNDLDLDEDDDDFFTKLKNS